MFTEIIQQYPWEKVLDLVHSRTEADVAGALASDRLDVDDLAALLSPAADPYLEELAELTSRITLQRFGSVVILYAPLYLSNECVNRCIYCGFNRDNNIERLTLSVNEAVEEASLLHNEGFRHILLLTGEAPGRLPRRYLEEVINRLHDRFSSITIEVFPMDVDGYRSVIAAGANGLTLYQETYNPETYAVMHPGGPKRDFRYRLEGPDRGGQAGFRSLGIGPLLGLDDWRAEGVYTLLHALHLQKKWWKSHVQVSFPRIRQAPGNFTVPHPVSDRDLTHIICASRIVLPDADLLLSTREPAELRDNLVPLGINYMSAGSRTEPGGYSRKVEADGQFAVIDLRSPQEIHENLRKLGYDAVWKDWDRNFLGR